MKIKTYSHLAVMSIIINYAVGTGILNLPHAVASASIGVSTMLIIIISCSSFLLGQYSLDALSKTFALTRAGKLTQPHSYQMIDEADDEEKYTKLDSEPENGSKPNVDFSIPNNYTTQFSTLCQLYFGRTGFYIYQIAIVIYFFGTIWGYGQVVSSSLTSVIPMTFLPSFKGDKWQCSDPCSYTIQACSDSYWIWLSIAGVFSCVMIFFNLSEQKVLQSIFTYCRFALLGITCVLIIYCLSTQPYLDKSMYKEGNFVNPHTVFWGFDLKAIGSLFSSITFSQVYHHSLPSIFQPTEKKYQGKLNISIMSSSIFLALITAIIAIPGALYFANDASDLITLNFNTWTGKGFDPTAKQPVFPQIISYVIRLLPPIYVLSSIPINGLTMSVNVQQMIPDQHREKKWVQITLNLLCIIPPILLAGFSRCLGVIIEFTGLMGYIIMLAPAVVLLKAKSMCKAEFGDTKSKLLHLNNLQYGESQVLTQQALCQRCIA
ncbi:Amino_acid transporter [Hexamita inflata]|uniref:Putative n=1 Tax=Hexamita inflata TaxID=28002 RepID=A0AA86NAJ9_9EUKA|nr:Amino acid transporter [Hexamita inflata]